MVIFLSLAILACAFWVISPNTKTRIAFILYFVLLYFLLTGIDGFIAAGKFSSNAEYAYLGIIEMLLLFHLPLLFRITQIDHKTHNIKSARAIFDKDLAHMTNSELHRHLQH